MKDDALAIVPNEIQTEWYAELIEECKAIITEAVFTSRWALVEGYHALGERVATDQNFKKFTKGNEGSLQGLARNIGISERTLYYALQFYQKYPRLDAVPEGKNITWNKLITKYLSAGPAREAPLEPPEGQYNVIVVDPPWPIEKIQRDCRPNQIAIDYPVMTLDEIVALRLPNADNCHVWLWTTHRFLPDAFRIMAGWSTNYVCTFVWHKPGGFQVVGLPQFNCEFALYGRIGGPEFSSTKGLSACFSASRGKHSEKPEIFYEIVRNSTTGRRLDMFSRRTIEGFDAWGVRGPRKMNPEIEKDFNYATPGLLKPSSKEDREEGIDGWICGFPFAARKRRKSYDDITIRYQRLSGSKTEYAKILEGTFRAKIFLYEFPDKTVLVSTDSIKRALENHLFSVIPNKDNKTVLAVIKLNDVRHLMWKKNSKLR